MGGSKVVHVIGVRISLDECKPTSVMIMIQSNQRPNIIVINVNSIKVPDTQ